MRRLSPERRSVPSRTSEASRSAPIARTSCAFPLSANTDVRDATRSPSTFASALISSSVIPSLRYSLSGSGLALTNGRTAIVRVVMANGRFGSDLARVSAPQKSMIDANRCDGSFASAFSSTRSNPDGASGRNVRRGRALSVTCFAIVARALVPLNGGSPASIS